MSTAALLMDITVDKWLCPVPLRIHGRGERMLPLRKPVERWDDKKIKNKVFPISAQAKIQILVMRVIDLYTVSVVIILAHIINVGTCLIKLGLCKWRKCPLKHYPAGS